MTNTMKEVLQFTRENDVKFIRLAFCDIFGVMKNISIMPEELPRAFESGISFDASAIESFMNVDESDLLLFPDPTTLSVLPWRPSHGRVIRLFCNIKYPDGKPFEGDLRYLLKEAVTRAERIGYQSKIGVECEFYLFKLDENGNPTLNPQDDAGYFDIAPWDRGENVRREICLTLEEMGVTPESSHHEKGPGQNEIAFKFSDALTAADNFTTFKSVVKTIAARNGLYASFMPKPLQSESGNGLHINLSLTKNGDNIFNDASIEAGSPAAGFVEGILRRIPEITTFINPITNSYARLGHYGAPRYITWSYQNRAQLMRLITDRQERSRIELRSPDPAINPYLVYMLLLNAGLEGIEQGHALRDPVNLTLTEEDHETDLLASLVLPETLSEAVKLSENSTFIRGLLPEITFEKYVGQKRGECDAYAQGGATHQFDLKQYFQII
jgi:glutamine synthetase